MYPLFGIPKHWEFRTEKDKEISGTVLWSLVWMSLNISIKFVDFLFICMCVCMCASARECVRGGVRREQLCKLILSFLLCVSPEVYLRPLGLHRKCLCLLSHLVSP